MTSKTSESVFQPMPPLSEDQLAALREDIAKNGVLVPVTVDQHGRVLDGHNRSAIARELGIDYPTVVVEVADDEAAMDLAVTLNGARRHLNQEQKRALIEHELIRRPDDSDRAISRRVGCSPTTVGTVRSERRARAEESTQRARDAFGMGFAHMVSTGYELLILGVPPATLTTRLEYGRDQTEAGYRRIMDGGPPGVDATNQELADFISHQVYVGLIEEMNSIVAEVESDGVTKFPLPARLPAESLDALVEQLYPLLDPVQFGHSETKGCKQPFVPAGSIGPAETAAVPS
ncbi:ParB N-terminal domain-containing protein [Pimelobacter simplex]|uniref:ParB-like N-terminal domain-containing protein n=1 Tax=Nocardioides simplex TaxID=2045 RepID=A0A0A1DKZ8_NOCSI|nr:ParB N-terminal domain-containing protein [Pimelobacter simplex]AIY17989.1 conserved hypothetical protein-putative transcriptional regulator [Pimelobacter simplex]MCG8152575.1 ParB N-terminal domain-containing protein [Pimelobacter simplex]GEB17046.1 hypothetical protein NSI01_53610 [Pimelobacter simplex]SFM76741.1 chromosome partitioning protein, ParB family [Pimelobacter simplex]